MTAQLRCHSQFYLDTWLQPLSPFLERNDVTDIFVNRPGEAWTEALGGEIERHDIPALDRLTLERLVRQIAGFSHQGISREHPLLAATLPDGSRVQIAIPPVTRGEIAFAIRKHVSSNMTLDDYDAAGLFKNVASVTSVAGNQQLLASDDLKGILQSAVKRRANVLISGGTATGKTTFLNALLREIPNKERLLLIEDAPELQIHHLNFVGLLAARSALREADVTADDLLVAALRMRPDRIILGEIRGAEALTFLRAINTGHPGAMATIHADGPERAVEQLAMLVLQSGSRLSWGDVIRYVRSTIDVYVHLDRQGGKRSIGAVRLREQMEGGQ